MNHEELERYKVHLVKQQWKTVMKDVSKIYRFA